MDNQSPDGLNWPALRSRLAAFLPAPLFNQLQALPDTLADDSGDIPANIIALFRTVVQTLEPLYRVLVNYSPRYLLELNPSPGRPHGELIRGTFIFADLTGFTALTELLSRHGQSRGPEMMNRLMNRLFTAILDPLIASGGDLLIFAGDAALAYFPHQPNGSDVLQATRAALRMQRAILPFASLNTEFGQCSLTMSAGVERGPAYAGVVGTRRRMELLVSGPAIGGATRAEEQAAAGQVYLGPQARPVAADHFTLAGAQVVDDFGPELGDYELALPARRQGRPVLLGLNLPEMLAAVNAALVRVEQLAPFLPEDILARLVNTSRQRRLQPELRPVATQFVNISGLETLALEQGPELATRVLQRYFVRAQEVVSRHQGIISQVDAYGNSFILLNTFGAPAAHEGTQRLAVSAALELDRALARINRDFNLNPPLHQRTGLTYGLTFNGEIGAGYRRETVIAGPAVNRAARLMSKARPGQVILDAGIWQQVQPAFVGRPLPPVNLKGIDGPVVIVNVQAMRRGARLQPPEQPLLGREAEQSRLAGALDDLLAPEKERRGSAWLITGDTGLGKTWLAADLAQTARERGATVLAGLCQPHGRHIPLFPWVDALAGWLNETDPLPATPQNGEPAGPVRDKLRAALAALDMPAAEQALAGLLGLSRPNPADSLPPDSGGENPTAMLDALQNRVQSDKPDRAGLHHLLNHRLGSTPGSAKTGETPSVWAGLKARVNGPEVIARLVKKLARQQPLLLILEDIDWADRDSLAVLNALLPNIAALPLLVVVTAREPPKNLLGQPAHLPLAPLPRTAVEKVAGRVLGASKLDPALANWVCSQAAGNPLYAAELCRELLRADAVHLDRARGVVFWTRLVPEMPLLLHQLLLARLDTLPLDRQEVLRRAAVIGMSFEYEAVRQLCRDRMPAEEVQTALDAAVQAGFLTAPEDGVYRFNHPLMQQAIYATLSFARRQEWHTCAGDWLAETGQSRLEQVAHHYLQGNNPAKAARFGRMAGDKARACGAYAGAIEYYQQVHALDGAPAQERMQAAVAHADLLAVQGDYAAAAAVYQTAAGLGSAGAAARQAIVTGNMARLSQIDAPSCLRPWLNGARAWLLAQQGQTTAALEIARQVQAGLPEVEEPARAALDELIRRCEAHQPPGDYDVWIQAFVAVICSR